jgi:hypothetical protein
MNRQMGARVMTTNNIDREPIADKLSHRKCDTELTEKELGKVNGGSSAGEHFKQATLTVRAAPPEKHWFNGG